MKLTILDCISLLNILPKEGNIVDLIQVKGIAKAIEITAKEATEIELKQDGNNLSWNLKKAKDKEFKPSVEQILIIKGIFSKLDAEKKMRIELLDLYEKFNVL